MSTIKEIHVPDIGNFSSVEVIEVSVKPGDAIQAEGTLITLETEKASMEIPSPFSGTIQDLKVKVGDKVSQGTLVALVEVTETATAEKAAASTPAQAPAPAASVAAPPTPPPAKVEPTPVREATPSADNSEAYAGPATRRLARELGVDLTKVSGTGRKGRVVTTDIHTYVKSILQNQGSSGGFSIEKAPDIDFTQFGEIEVKPLNRIKKWTAKNLHRNWISIPHVTQFDEADVTELETFRQENKQAAEDNGIKLTPLAFIMKAVVSGLRAYPQFNASLASNGTDLIYKKYFHLGIAVDTPNGLVVPVVRDVDSKGLFDLARELAVISALARDGKLKNEQMSGSCFSISSLGGVGGTAFTPIINAPDVAILGVSKVQIRPVFMDNQWVPRKMLPLSLSYDHRVIDGAEGARFVTHIASQLQDIRKLLL
jgi:pyruvate dehydrogenase E2 component (dihydrolipoamide acetyltransferase)